MFVAEGIDADCSQLEIPALIRSYLSGGGLYLMGNEADDARVKNTCPVVWRM